LFGGNRIGYIGGTSYPSDARDVYHRWRDGEQLLEGPHVCEFEDALKDYYGGLDVITFGAGRVALYAILKAMNLREGGEVILPGYTCVVTSSAIRYAGLRPVYVDVSVRDFNMLPELAEKAVTPRTQAILAQHTFGIPCDMDMLLDISKRFGIPLIEDGAHAIGARWDQQLVGKFGYAGFFSTQATKMLSTERGGYAVTVDKNLSGRIREIQKEAGYASTKEERACLLRWCYRAAFSSRAIFSPQLQLFECLVQKLRIPWVYDILGYDREEYQCALEGNRPRNYPSRLTNLMAYAGLLQLKRLEEDIVHRRILAEYLESRLPALGANVAAYNHERAQPSWIRYPFVVENRKSWIIAMEKSGISPGFWLNAPIHPKESDWRKAGYEQGTCPNAEYLGDHILNLPVHKGMSIDRIDRFLKLCHKINVS
jgi:dTDP-4-amino-4,6-dideoxygalactose transaminase